jgi:hypothetical protein
MIERAADGFVALCPELDIASRGGNVEETGRICDQQWSYS